MIKTKKSRQVKSESSAQSELEQSADDSLDANDEEVLRRTTSGVPDINHVEFEYYKEDWIMQGCQDLDSGSNSPRS